MSRKHQRQYNSSDQFHATKDWGSATLMEIVDRLEAEDFMDEADEPMSKHAAFIELKRRARKAV